MTDYTVSPVAHIRTGFSSKFGIPRQGGIVSEICGRIIFKKEYSGADWTRGLEGFSHIWVLWVFSENVNDLSEIGYIPFYKYREMVRTELTV